MRAWNSKNDLAKLLFHYTARHACKSMTCINIKYCTVKLIARPNLKLKFFLQLCELGNLSIHLLLKNLRPPGTKVRRVPMPDGNPFSQLFNFVSCPNYTYEFGSWLFFTIMTKCAPGKLTLYKWEHLYLKMINRLVVLGLISLEAQ